MNWNELRFSKHAGKSLPQVLMCDPDWFFWAIEMGVFADRPTLRDDAHDLNILARRICIPKVDGLEWEVEHFFQFPTMKYVKFELVPPSSPRHAGASHTVRSPVIDLTMPRRYARYDKLGNSLLLRQVKRFHFGSQRATRERIEDFFSSEDNFSLSDVA